MRSQSETESVVACQQVVAELAVLLDHEGLSQIDALFSAHPIVSLFGSEVRGIEEIRALFRSCTEGMVNRHALSPSYVELTSPDSARAITYATVYRGLHQPGFAGPLPAVARPESGIGGRHRQDDADALVAGDGHVRHGPGGHRRVHRRSRW